MSLQQLNLQCEYQRIKPIPLSTFICHALMCQEDIGVLWITLPVSELNLNEGI